MIIMGRDRLYAIYTEEEVVEKQVYSITCLRLLIFHEFYVII